ncbi:tyrosine-type recombinase/integrase [Nonomuraea ceibae]|uniref:tyrosine-type recombinase/integrase n=1 Tax=Nonomuraea ceibae TaxID=1935170 RepID=UPI001C5E494C|nr:site-specific integrase [Nonomuraea ceibae]
MACSWPRATTPTTWERPATPADSAILATLYTSGLRREELVTRTLADWNPDEQSLRVLGRGNKERVAYVPADTARLIKDWVGVRGRTPGALFPPIRKGGQIRTTPDGRPAHMTGQAVRKILIKRIGQASKLDPAILDRRVAPHDFRRTFIGELLDAGVDLATAQALVGHSSPATTARYDRRPEKTRRAAVQRLRLPDPARGRQSS